MTDIREHNQNLLFSCLNNNFPNKFNNEDIINFEQLIYNKSRSGINIKNYSQIYMNLFYEIYAAINPLSSINKNTDIKLIEQRIVDIIKSKDLNLFNIVEMKWKKIKDSINERQILSMTYEPSFSDDICSKCKKQKVVVTNLQQRSADEGFTTHYHCKNCGYHWKLN